ncbi:MAG: DUF3164 family protein [Sphaerochaetaceae bacterium]|nr:DUF3164 family protein [Sphaerochaetaceae bacterium]
MAIIEESTGRWLGADGKWHHKGMIRIDKQLEDETVNKWVERANELAQQIKQFKLDMYAECYLFDEVVRSDYDAKPVITAKGNMTLTSFDGTKKVEIKVNKLINFDHKLKYAKEKIDEWFAEKTADADDDLKTIIDKYFDVKGDKVDVRQILGLKQLNINHPLWNEAMKIIDESITIAGTKSYIRFKERVNGEIDGVEKTLNLDFSKFPIHEIEILNLANKKKEVKDEQK